MLCFNKKGMIYWIKKPLVQALTVCLSLSLVGCGGGGDSSGFIGTDPKPSTPPPNSTPQQNDTSSPTNPVTPSLPNNSVSPDNSTKQMSVEEKVVFDLLNNQREQCGFGKLNYNQQLAISAENHAKYLTYVSSQNKQSYISHTEESLMNYHNTGLSNPYFSGRNLQERLNTKPSNMGIQAKAVNYPMAIAGENISSVRLETVRSNEVIDKSLYGQKMLANLLSAPYHLKSLVDPMFDDVGLSYQQSYWQENRNNYYGVWHIWANFLEIVSASSTRPTSARVTQVLNYPCDGVTGTSYELRHESPNPFGNTRNLSLMPIGQSVYVLAPYDKVITHATVAMYAQNDNVSKIHILTKNRDPNSLLKSNEIVFMPDKPLQPATQYTVNYTLTYLSGEKFNRTFRFTTRANN